MKKIASWHKPACLLAEMKFMDKKCRNTYLTAYHMPATLCILLISVSRGSSDGDPLFVYMFFQYQKKGSEKQISGPFELMYLILMEVAAQHVCTLFQ